MEHDYSEMRKPTEVWFWKMRNYSLNFVSLRLAESTVSDLMPIVITNMS